MSLWKNRENKLFSCKNWLDTDCIEYVYKDKGGVNISKKIVCSLYLTLQKYIASLDGMMFVSHHMPQQYQ